MEKVNYLRKGKIYEFHQFFEPIGMVPKVDFHELHDSRTTSDTKEVNQDLGFSGGYMSIDKEGDVRFWGSKNLRIDIDRVHLDLYRESKKFTNLRFA